MIQTIGFIGGGNMASSLIGGILRQRSIAANNVYLFEPNREKALSMKAEYGLNLCESNAALIAASDAIVIAVKPQVLESVLSPLKDDISAKNPLLISVVAGIRADSIQRWLSNDIAIVRVMPNTPALVGKGASGLFGNSNTSDVQKRFTESVLSSVGLCQWVASEDDIDSVTALSGSGPAYFMLFIQGLVEAARSAGLDEVVAKQLAVQTAAGAAELIASSDLPLQTLIDNVTSPKGTTEAALKSFAADELNLIVEKAFLAAKHRSEELAQELG